MLCRIDGANPGYMAHMHTDPRKGSFLSYNLYKALRQKPQSFLFEILSEIERNLEKIGRQLIKFHFQNETGYIKFLEKVQFSENAVEFKEEAAPKDVELMMGMLSRPISDERSHHDDDEKVEEPVVSDSMNDRITPS